MTAISKAPNLTVAATGKHPGQPTYGTIYDRFIDHEGFKRCGLKPYSDDSELAELLMLLL